MGDNSYETNPLEFIAQGVEARYDLLMGYTQVVTERTAVIARDLGIPEDHIERWAMVRQEQSMSRIRRVYSLLDKLECNVKPSNAEQLGSSGGSGKRQRNRRRVS